MEFLFLIFPMKLLSQCMFRVVKLSQKGIGHDHRSSVVLYHVHFQIPKSRLHAPHDIPLWTNIHSLVVGMLSLRENNERYICAAGNWTPCCSSAQASAYQQAIQKEIKKDPSRRITNFISILHLHFQFPHHHF